jgi:hypothetical protein
MKSFVSETDVTELKKHNINYEVDIIVFINEMKQYFYNTWTKDYHKDIDNCTNTIESFNTLIGGFPSTGSAHIISDSFDDATDEDLEILSEKTIGILGYFYQIYLN